VRSALLLALAAGCYAPSVTPGAPCDPQVGNCPRPLVCVAGTGGFTCERTGGLDPDDAAIDVPITPDPDAAIDAMTLIDASPDAAIDAPLVMHVEYPSMVADCVNRGNPNPDTCISVNGNGQLAVDLRDSQTNNPWDGFVRFDLDNMIAGRVVTSVKLRMTTTSDTKAVADNSGVIWQVLTFTRASLAVSEPAQVGGSPIAGSQGSVIKNQDVLWPLPTTIVSSVFLEITTPSADGTNYWNQTGTRPPRLLIDLQ
jgi:hypothetical protein